MSDNHIYQKTAKGRTQQRHADGGLSRELEQTLRLIDGQRSVQELSAALNRHEKANFILALQALEKKGLIRPNPTDTPAATGPARELLQPTGFDMIAVTELGPEESVFAWAAATRGARELQQNGFFSNPMRADREHHTRPPGALRALVVDDEAVIVDLITVALEEQGYLVSSASSAEGAMDALLRMGRPDLVLLDVMMPGRNGFELLAAIRADRHLADVPVIMVTALTSNEHVHRGLTLGADGYIFKPIKWEKLFDCIVGVVGR